MPISFSNSPTPSDGERRALLGLVPQYRLFARHAYLALRRGDLEWVELMSQKAGAMDDVLLSRGGQIEAYQLKHSSQAQVISLAALLKHQRKASSLLRTMADGWKQLRSEHPMSAVQVHLVFRGVAGKIGRLPSGDFFRGSFEAYLKNEWGRPPEHGREEIRQAIVEASGLPPDQFAQFFAASAVEFVNSMEPLEAEWAEADVRRLTGHLMHLAGSDRRPGRISRDVLLSQLGWTHRFQSYSSHEWKVDSRYQRIQATIEPLEKLLRDVSTGYAALLGTPGSGKSTTLAHTLRRRPEWRFIPYFAFVPGDPGQARGEAHHFLHDLVVAFHRQGVHGNRGFATDDLPALQEEFSAILAQLAVEFQSDGRRTVVLVDGLDHIPREQRPTLSLLQLLPHPDTLPAGVLFVLGSQSLELPGLSPAIVAQLAIEQRTVKMEPMGNAEIRGFLEHCQPPLSVTDNQFERIKRLSEGHPLALALLAEQIGRSGDAAEIDAALDRAPAYAGHIERRYEVFWRELRGDPTTRDLLARWARLRGTWAPTELGEAFGDQTVAHTLARSEPYLRKSAAGTVDFFHNSFRQFVLRATQQTPLGRDQSVRLHRDLATRFAALPVTCPLSWETVHHAAEAGQTEAVHQGCRLELLREQFHALRPVQSIFDDLYVGLKLARQNDDRIRVLELLLVWLEFSRRSRAVEHVDRLSVLYRSWGALPLRRFLEYEGWVKLGSRESIQLCHALLEAGERSYARELYEQIEPHHWLGGHKPVETGLGGNPSQDLGAWIGLAVEFRPLTELLAGIQRLHFENDEAGRLGDAPEIDALRTSLLARLACVLAERDDWAGVETIRHQVLPERLDDWQESVDWHLVNQPNNRAESMAALLRLEQRHADGEHAADLAEIAWRLTRDAQRVRIWLDRATQPSAPLRTELYGANPAIRDRLLITRLQATISRGRTVDQIVGPCQDEITRGNWLFDRALTQIALLWGAGRAGRFLDPDELRLYLPDLLRLFCRPWRDTEAWSDWHRLKSERAQLYTWLVRATALHGANALQTLAAELDRVWHDRASHSAWTPDLRREIARELHRQDHDRAAYLRRLAAWENDCDLKYERVDARVTEYLNAAEAWLDAGEVDRAQASYRRMLQTAHGLPDRDGGQAPRWVQWWRKAVHEDGGLLAASPWLASLLEQLERLDCGEDRADAAADFLSEVAELDLARCHAFARRFVEEGAVGFDAGIAAVLRSTLRHHPAHRRLAVTVAQRLLLPFAESDHAETGKAIIESAAEQRPEFVQSLHIAAAPLLREAWLELLDEPASPPPPDVHKPTVDDFDRSFPARTAARRQWREIRSATAAIEFLRSPREEHQEIFRYSGSMDGLFDRFGRADQTRLAQAALESEWSTFVLVGIARELVRTGERETAAKLAERAFLRSNVRGWYRMSDGGSRIGAAQVWVDAAGENARTAVFAQWVDDCCAGRTHPPEHLDDLAELASLFLVRPPWNRLWTSLRAQVECLAEFREAALPEQIAAPPVSPPAAIAEWVLWCARLPVPELQEAIYRLLDEVTAWPEERAFASGLVESLLPLNREYRIMALDLIIRHPAIATPAFRDAVRIQLANRGGITRGYAAAVLRTLGESAAGTPATGHDELPPIYRFELPPLSVPESRLTELYYPKGRPPRDTEDRLVWVSVFDRDLEALSRRTGIPFANLVRRMSDLMLELAPREQWSEAAQDRLMSQMERSHLKLTYRHSRSVISTEAFEQLITELWDADQMDADDYYTWLGRLDPIDRTLIDAPPVRRPDFVRPPKIELLRQIESSRWLKEHKDSLANCVRTLPDGRVVLAELSRFYYLDRGKPTEIRCSVVFDASHRTPTWKRASGFLSTHFELWRADRYPILADTAREPALAVYGQDFFPVVGAGPWVAMNPAAASSLGWHTSNHGLFAWDDETGSRMVETIWWANGPSERFQQYQRLPTGHGWLVVATPAAVRTLTAQRGLMRILGVQRSSDELRESPGPLLAETELFSTA